MTYHTAQIDGWTFSLWESMTTNLQFTPHQFTLTTRETMASKVTWAWLTEPRVIHKPIIDLELEKVCEIILTLESQCWGFEGWLTRWTMTQDFGWGVTTIVIHGTTIRRIDTCMTCEQSKDDERNFHADQ